MLCSQSEFLNASNLLGKTAVLNWWHGNGSLLDYSNPAAVEWWHGQLDRVIVDTYYDLAALAVIAWVLCRYWILVLMVGSVMVLIRIFLSWCFLVEVEVCLRIGIMQMHIMVTSSTIPERNVETLV